RSNSFSVFIENALRQDTFLSLHCNNFFFHRAFSYQLIDENWVFLAYAMGAVSSLIFYSRVPPRIVMNYGVSGGEVQPYTARFETDQENWDLSILETFYGCGAIASVPGKFDIGQ